LTGWI